MIFFTNIRQSLKNYFAKSFILRFLLVFSPIPLLYLLLSRFGYVIPITEIPGMLCIKGCVLQSFVHTPVRGYELVNGDKLYPHPQRSKFMWLDYPNRESWKKHLLAKSEGEFDWFLPVGGEVGIHGVPQGSDGFIDKRQNWTLGCPSLKNKDVDEIYGVVQRGTVV
ncbi:hypothetical protein NIES4071_89560 [Calothrix sp. NIES-4071]|nr:hypothetical protein NIES4071_89560 [Calothrix sp. NIES-4071]BAZ63223.1 hypothetical protein NIES4105_89490 [Calothrix sp. NIES-4105]